jgi:hypothetical protein
MPYTVQTTFEKFRENIELSGDHRETASKRKDRIVSLLGNEFEILDAFPSGSIPRFTAVKGYADLDIIVVLHYGKHIKGKKPSQVLQAVRDCLGEYKTNVRKNGQAVTLYYDSWPNVDIVPVSRVVNDDGSVNYYSVPDMNTESWLSSRPRKHSNVLSKKNKEFGDMFKHIIKMIKWWNHQHSSFLQSFHIEVMALNIFDGELTDYSWNIFQYFDKAVDLASSSLRYEISYADGYLDSETRKSAVERLKTARDKARDAWYFTYNGRNDHENAIEIWRQIFGDKFPAYGN